MKRLFKLFIATLTLVCMLLSLSSCSFFATMREYSKQATEITILTTPEEADISSAFVAALKNSEAEAINMSESVSYKSNNIGVTNEAGNADIFDKAAATLGNMIFANNPGKSDNEITPPALEGTLLSGFDGQTALTATASRNETEESVTDEEGEDVTNEEGEVVKELVITDNVLKLEFDFYEDTVVASATDGESEELPTERTRADADILENVFGEQTDKAAILANFDSIKDYITVKDYTTEYGDCKVTAEMNLETNRISSVNFERTLIVTATVEGVGAFAEYGEMTVTFELVKNTDYGFTYEETEE